MIYKVIARVTKPSRYGDRSKIGTQWKKKIYINDTKFQRHSKSLIYRWLNLGYQVEVYLSRDSDVWTELSNQVKGGE